MEGIICPKRNKTKKALGWFKLEFMHNFIGEQSRTAATRDALIKDCSGFEKSSYRRNINLVFD